MGWLLFHAGLELIDMLRTFICARRNLCLWTPARLRRLHGDWYEKVK